MKVAFNRANAFAVAAFLGALLASIAAASLLNNYMEAASFTEVTRVLEEGDQRWVQVRTSGLNIVLSGEAPDEAARFNAIATVQKVVAADRIVDDMTVAKPEGLAAPRYSMELLRNGDGVSLIGLIPAATGREAVLASIEDIAEGTRVTDMLETADHPVPDGWDAALAFAIESLRTLPRSKLSMSPGRVVITAISDSPEQKSEMERRLRAAAPPGVEVILHISAPRPVIAPFTLRFIKDDTGARFDACSAPDEASRKRILKAAREAGIEGRLDCAIGLGAPSYRWAEVVERALRTVTELGGGTLTISDTDLSIVAGKSLDQDQFDEIIGALEADLPDIFRVHAVLPPKPVEDGTDAARAEAEFLVLRSPEGLVQLRGRLPDERAKAAVASYAGALFGLENVHDTTRVDPSLPDGWTLRVLAGLRAMRQLHHGALTVREKSMTLSGASARQDVSEVVSRLLAEKLESGSDFSLDVRYDPALAPETQKPTPQECVDRINKVLAERQITFEPASATIDSEATATVDKIAEILQDCSDVKMEIGGHTDSQGRESMNLALSQARAEAVLDALLTRGVLTSNLTAKGYGESQPIADNDTEEGRAANRRIEFRLLEGDAATGNAENAESADATDAAETTEAQQGTADQDAHADENANDQPTQGGTTE